LHSACQDYVAESSSGCDAGSSSENSPASMLDSTTVANGTDNTNAPVAAGQIYEVGIDGQLTVEWVDGSRSKCSPHQLYLVSDEV